MDLQLHDRTALVTGASQGLGRAIAHNLAREGVRVALAARRRSLLEALALEITKDGGMQPIVIETDLNQPNASSDLATRAKQRLGRIDILINAAGGSRPVPLDAPANVWEDGMTVNFHRLRELSHALIVDMKESRFGRIINLTGTSEPMAMNVANAAKAAVHAWSKALSREVAKYNITVNSLQPGRIITEQILKLHPTEEDRRQFSERNIPAARFGEPDELAVLAVFLCSPIASYITGTVIPVDGGMSRFAF